MQSTDKPQLNKAINYIKWFVVGIEIPVILRSIKKTLGYQ